MKPGLIIIFFMLSSALAFAQTFTKKKSFVMPEQLSFAQAEWVDLNKDSLLDVVVSGMDTQNNLKLGVLKNASNSAFTYQSLGATGFTKGVFSMADLNHDNLMDLVLSGNTLLNTSATFPFLNNGAMVLQKQATKINDLSASLVKLADMDNDGKEDVVMAGNTNGTSFFKIYKATASGYVLKYDTAGIDVSSFILYDFDQTASQDVFISGTNASGPVCILMQNLNGLKFKTTGIGAPVAGQSSTGDLNNDGWFDVVVNGVTSGGTLVTSYLNTNGVLAASAPAPGVDKGSNLIADLDSDGLADVSVYGNANGQVVNTISNATGSSMVLDSDGLMLQRFGDYDRDGDLDFFQIADSIGYRVFRLYENTSVQKNKKPTVALTAFAISTYNKTFLYWATGTDDHTQAASLTYDVLLTSPAQSGSIMAPSFDIGTRTRMVVKHGNFGTKNSLIIRNLADGHYDYFIQAVDNAFNGSNPICHGGVSPCTGFDLKHKNIQACRNATIKLGAENPMVWFSTSKGFLGISDSLKFVAAAADTVYGFTQNGDCQKNLAYAIQAHDGSKTESSTLYACQGKVIKLGIETGWNQVSWKSKSISISGKDSIEYTLTKQDTVTATALSEGGCTYVKKFYLNISKPVVQLNGDAFQIMYGQSVPLAASGGKSYSWAPSTGLNQSTIADPVASPVVTTDYTVTVIDSVGCAAQGKVTVQVSSSAFVASLFTPNGDGKNDELKVYGLTSASRFTFRIYNREGSLVYEADSIGEATSGWNGISHGSQQPGGVYFWKVEGESASGDPLLLNGKRSGSILLVR